MIKRAVPINRFLYSTTVQNFTHLSYSFRVTKPIIGAGRWHGPKKGVENPLSVNIKDINPSCSTVFVNESAQVLMSPMDSEINVSLDGEIENPLLINVKDNNPICCSNL